MNLMQAIVVDTADPQDLERVRILAPELRHTWLGWTPVLRAYGAGSSSDKPEAGDRVLIGFINEDENFPVVMGRLGSG